MRVGADAVDGRRVNRLMVALFAAMIMGGFFRSSLSVLSKFIIEYFGLSRSQFGLILTCYTLALALGAPLLGVVTDRIGGWRLLVGRSVGVAVGYLGVAFAPSFGSVFVAIAFTGLLLAGGNPGTNQLIARDVAPGRRGTVMGVKQSGGQLGVLVAGLVLPSLALATSWRVSFGVGAAVPLVGLVLLLLLVSPDGPGPGGGRPVATSSHESGAVRRLVLIAVAMGAGVQVVFGFLPLYAQEAVHMSPAAAGGLASLMSVFGIGARIGWGRRSERNRHFSETLLVLALLSMAATIMIAAGQYVGSWLLWPAAACAGASLEAWNAVGNLAVVTSVDLQDSGRASGVLMFGFLAGGSTSPFVFGLVVDHFGNYTWGWGLALATLSVASYASWRWRRLALRGIRREGEGSRVGR